METTIKAIKILVTSDGYDETLYKIMQYHKTLDDIWDFLEDEQLFEDGSLLEEFIQLINRINVSLLLPLENELISRMDMNLGIEIYQLFTSNISLSKKINQTVDTLKQLDFKEKYIFILLFSQFLKQFETEEVFSFLHELSLVDEEIASIFVSSEYFCQQIMSQNNAF